jgi:hypothetical protein
MRWLLTLFFAFHFSLSGQNLLDSLLHADTNAVMKKVLANPDKYRLQIIYSRIIKTEKGVSLNHYYFRHKPDEYFYPASLVKLPAAALALEKLNWMALDNVNRKTPLWVNPKFSGINKDTFRYPSIEENITRMLVMSDNPSFNRLYDFLGQEYMHLRMRQLQYPDVRLVQRLSSASYLENKTTGPFAFADTIGKILFKEKELVCYKNFPCPASNAFVGKAYYDGRKKILKPKDFSESNFIPLKSAHSMLISILYPQALPESQRFELSDDQYHFLRSCMGAYPRESSILEYKSDTNLFDAVRKYILFGSQKGLRNDTLRSYNKVGLAYGFVSDLAYVRDLSSGAEYFVSCVLYANDNEILNDGRYEYNSVGFPFMKCLGQLLLNYEKKKRGCPN